MENNNNILISLIIPVYNAEIYLEECLNSIVNQTYKNYEVICIDDCSTDNSLNILKKYSNFKIIQNTQNKGVDICRTIGYQQASGDYVLFLDNDDYVEHELIEKLTEVIKNNADIDIIEFRFNLLSSKTEKNIGWLDRGESGIRAVGDNNILAATALWNKCYKKIFIDKFGLRFDESSRVSCGEIPFVICAYLLAKKFYYLDYIGYNWRRYHSSLSTNNLKKHYNSFFPMLDFLKCELVRLNIFNEKFYKLLCFCILAWKLNTILFKKNLFDYYNKCHNLFKSFQLNEYYFKLNPCHIAYSDAYKLYRWVRKYNFWQMKINILFNPKRYAMFVDS